MFKVNNGDTTKRFEIWSKSTINTSVFIVNSLTISQTIVEFKQVNSYWDVVKDV